MFVIHDFSYYHALGPEILPRSTSYSPLSSVQELQVVSGVCSLLEAVDALTRGVGCDAVGTWHGVPNTR